VRRRPDWLVVLGALAVAAGLAVVGFFIFVFVAMSQFGSNK
jgi:hypothetical protein